MGADIPGIVKLRCAMKNYDWGKFGGESAVARLYAKNSGEEVEADEPYAELWMGTHVLGLSYVVVPAEVNGGAINGDFKAKHANLVSLNDWIERNPSVLGDKVLKKWGTTLPFLFKVLSVAKALSIQAHPDKELAEILHKQQPGVYKDDNHKPEMVLALTQFEALCGFVSLEELKTVLHSVPEITEVVSSSCVDQVLNIREEDGEKKLKEVLQSLFTALMSASKPVVSGTISKLISRLNLKRELGELTTKEELVLRLEKQFPGDVGVIAAFLFNFVKLNPGEALYLRANEPHAYLHGECVECMAASDNVVRAGLTHKNRDDITFCSMLTYEQGFPKILSGVPSNRYTIKYLPPFDEFEVDRCNLPEDASTVFPAVSGPSIFVVVEGEGTMRVDCSKMVVSEGDLVFAPANSEITLETISGLNVYRAGVNSRVWRAWLLFKGLFLILRSNKSPILINLNNHMSF